MGHLARLLATQFAATPIPGWRCHPEERLLDPDLARRYGYTPQVDVMLHSTDGRRVAVELEISRADPVANQVKFLLAHRAPVGQPPYALVSMFSSHIKRGRRNIAGVFAR